MTGALAFVGGAFAADLITARALDKKTARTFPVTAQPEAVGR